MVVMFSTVVSFINKCSFRSYKFDKVDTFSSKLTTSPCSKSPHAHITERPRKHESEARVLIWRPTRFVRGRLITKILHLSERVTHLHIAVPTKTRFYASRIHVLKTEQSVVAVRPFSSRAHHVNDSLARFS